MIRSIELRIGNIVTTTCELRGIRIPTGTPVKILSVGHFECDWLLLHQVPACTENWNKSSYKNIEGIPLTNEWFSFFGFQWNGKDSHTKDGIIIKSTDFNHYACHPWTSDLIYVHQLQNLYLDLKGDELTIKIASLNDGWVKVTVSLPDEKVLVDAMLGESRICEQLMRIGDNWYCPDGAPYIWSRPTYWRHVASYLSPSVQNT